MLQSTIIGHLGSDAVEQKTNGKEFVSFRIANTDRWTDDAGQVHESTTWVDCIMNGQPAVLPYLKKGQMVYASGSCTLRVYSSAKDKCMKAGLTINVRQLELLGGKGDDVPSRLNSEDGKEVVEIGKYFYAEPAKDGTGKPIARRLVSRSGQAFIQDENGWITREVKQES